MKTRIALLAGLFWLMIVPVTAQDDKTAIKAVIEKETTSFFNADRKAWEDTWVHEPYAYWSYSDSTGTSFIEGWDAVNRTFDEYFRTHVAGRNIDVAHQGNNKITIDRTWKDIRIYGNGAFVHYIQRVKDGGIQRDETSQIRVMEKKDGKWRVVCVNAIASYPVE